MRKISTRTFSLGTLVLVAVALITIAFTNHWFDFQRDAPTLVKSQESKSPLIDSGVPIHEVLGLGGEEMLKVGEVSRPRRDVEFPDRSRLALNEGKNPLPDPGSSPYLRGDENEQVAGLFKELQLDQPPAEAQSVMFAPEPFDLASYEADPQSYLNKTRPGRVFQSAQPGPDTSTIEPVGDTYWQVIQGERVVLRVKAKPSMPVTFHTQQLGEFENRLKTISVAANEKGIAEATYLAGPGTIGLINILAASPIHSEDVHFMVDVLLPDSK